jgi:hypothetical protein
MYKSQLGDYCMNKYMKCMALLSGLLMLSSTMQCDDTNSVDHDIIVNEIKKKSDITDYDVQKVKFVSWVGRSLAYVTGAALAGAAAYGGHWTGEKVGPYVTRGSTIQGITRWTGEKIPSAYVQTYTSSGEQWLTRPSVAAGMAGTFVGYKAYQSIASRTRDAMRDKVKKFIALCAKLPVANEVGVTADDVKKLVSRSSYTAAKHAYKDPITTYRVIENLYQQAIRAEALIKELKLSVKLVRYIKDANGKIEKEIHYKENLETNMYTFKPVEEIAEAKESGIKVQKLHEKNLEVGIAVAKTQWWANVVGVVQGTVKTTKMIAEFIKEHPLQSAAIGGVVVGAYSGAYSKAKDAYSKAKEAYSETKNAIFPTKQQP